MYFVIINFYLYVCMYVYNTLITRKLITCQFHCLYTVKCRTHYNYFLNIIKKIKKISSVYFTYCTGTYVRCQLMPRWSRYMYWNSRLVTRSTYVRGQVPPRGSRYWTPCVSVPVRSCHRLKQVDTCSVASLLTLSIKGIKQDWLTWSQCTV